MRYRLEEVNYPNQAANHTKLGMTRFIPLKSILPRPATPNWKAGRSTAYKKQFNSLDGLYYSHGQIRLENLMDWTKGQTEGPPIEMHVPIDSQ